jgi:hypothetical protein
MQPGLFSTDEQLLQQVASAATASNHNPTMNLMSGGVEEAIIVQEEHLVDHGRQIVAEQQTAVDTLDGNASDGSNDGFFMAAPLARRIRRGRSLAALSDEEPANEEPSSLQSIRMDTGVTANEDNDDDDDDDDSMGSQIIGVKRRRTTAMTSFSSSKLTNSIDKEEEDNLLNVVTTTTTATVAAESSSINDSSTINSNTSSNGIKIRIRYPTTLKGTSKSEGKTEATEKARNEKAPIGRSLRNRNRRSYVEPSGADLEAALVSDDTFNDYDTVNKNTGKLL